MHKHSAHLDIKLKCDKTTDVKPQASNGMSHTARYSIIYQDMIIGATFQCHKIRYKINQDLILLLGK